MSCKLSSVNEKWPGERYLEEKFDGWRAEIVKDADDVQIWTKNGNNYTLEFPDVVQAIRKNVRARQIILDSELTPKNEDFNSMGSRNVKGTVNINEAVVNVPLVINPFDILSLNGHDLTALALKDRKKKLAEEVSDWRGVRVNSPANVEYAQAELKLVEYQLMNYKEARAFTEDIFIEDGEGSVAKNPFSRYMRGKRNSEWIKLKRSETTDVQIVGVTHSTNPEDYAFGALVCSLNGKFFTKVGTGFDIPERDRILNKLRRVSGISGVSFPSDVNKELMFECKPQLAEIRMQQFTKNKQGGKSARHAVFLRFREADKAGAAI